jgi:hypothetical protein
VDIALNSETHTMLDFILFGYSNAQTFVPHQSPQPREVDVSIPWSGLPVFVDILKHHSLDLTDAIEVHGGGSPETEGNDDESGPETSEIDDEDYGAEFLTLWKDEAALDSPGIKT